MFKILVWLFNVYWACYYNGQKWFFPKAHWKMMREEAKNVQNHKHFSMMRPGYQRAINLVSKDPK